MLRLNVFIQEERSGRAICHETKRIRTFRDIISKRLKAKAQESGVLQGLLR